MFLNKLIILQLLHMMTCKGIINKNSVTNANYKALQNDAIYLNSEHPLWILQDRKNEQLPANNSIRDNRNHRNLKTLKHHKTPKQQLRAENNFSAHFGGGHLKSKIQKRLSKEGVQLPRNYIPFKNTRTTNSRTSARQYKNSKFIKNMPVFDAVPGEESFTKSTPIFIYAGHKARMLLNTMLSEHKYPMQEPVPGQVLQPPPSLIFKPKPLVENLQRQLNVTMIPFYDYEAIDLTTSAPPALFQPAKKYKKAKQYTSFFSPEEVHSTAALASSQYHYNIEYTTSTPLTLEKPFANHRFENNPTSSTTPLPHKKLEVSYSDGEDKFQITYEDDATHLERPLKAQFTTTQTPVTYESYTFDNNYYAFPVYTMSKLMETDDGPRHEESVSIERQRIEQLIDTALKEEHDKLLNQSNEDTWFILNSRYKGPLKETTAHGKHSSKYIQSSPAKPR